MFNLNKIDTAKYIAIDTETHDPRLKTHGPGGFRKDGFIAGISFATDNGLNEYLPINHQGGGNLDKEKVIRYIYYPKDEMERASISFHLTSKEKKDVLRSYFLKKNDEKFARLRKALE